MIPGLLILTFAGLCIAQTEKVDNLAAQAAQVTEFEVNGLKVIVKRRPLSPTVAAALFIRGGARNINDKNAGIEDLMLKSAIEAGKKYPRQLVRRELSRTGSGIAASAGNDYSAISLVTTRPNFDRTWDIFSDVLLNPVFAPEDVERNREASLSGLREAETMPEGALDAAIDRFVYARHPYANDVSGTVATVSSFKAADLIAYHQQMMQTSRLLMVFVGDLDANELKTRIAASFGKLPRGDYKELPFPPLDFSKPSLDIVARPTLPTNYVQGVFAAPSLNSPDYYAMQVAMAILQQLVYQEVRVARQLSYAPAADVNKFAANTANISVSAVDVNQAVKVMLDQIDTMRTQILKDDVVSEVAGNFLTTYYLSQETSSAQAGDLARYELIGGGWRNSFDFLNRVRAVKPADLSSVSNKYMRNLRFVVVGNPAKVDRSIFLQTQQTGTGGPVARLSAY